MTTPESPAPDDILARAEEALRQAPVPETMSEETSARILAALHAATGPRPPVPTWRRFAPWALRSAAAIVLVAGLGYIAAAWLSRPALAFAAVARKLRDARTLTYRATLQLAGEPGPIALRVLVKAPALIRCEVEPGGYVILVDATGNRILVLEPKARSALLVEGQAAVGAGVTNLAAMQVERFRELAEARSEPVGRRRIGAIEAEGFRVGKGEQEMLAWVDPRARALLRIDLKTRVDDVEVPVSLADFQFDPSLDDALFRFEAPAGYVLSTAQNAAMSDDEVIADILRTYAGRSNGRFPHQFTEWAIYADGLPDDDLGAAANSEAIRLVQNITRVQFFLAELKGDYGYRPEGVKLGDAGKVLFWYRRKGSAGYRAIYGDLHAADVTADQLPGRAGGEGAKAAKD